MPKEKTSYYFKAITDVLNDPRATKKVCFYTSNYYSDFNACCFLALHCRLQYNCLIEIHEKTKDGEKILVMPDQFNLLLESGVMNKSVTDLERFKNLKKGVC